MSLEFDYFARAFDQLPRYILNFGAEESFALDSAFNFDTNGKSMGVRLICPVETQTITPWVYVDSVVGSPTSIQCELRKWAPTSSDPGDADKPSTSKTGTDGTATDLTGKTGQWVALNPITGITDSSLDQTYFLIIKNTTTGQDSNYPYITHRPGMDLVYRDDQGTLGVMQAWADTIGLSGASGPNSFQTGGPGSILLEFDNGRIMGNPFIRYVSNSSNTNLRGVRLKFPMDITVSAINVGYASSTIETGSVGIYDENYNPFSPGSVTNKGNYAQGQREPILFLDSDVYIPKNTVFHVIQDMIGVSSAIGSYVEQPMSNPPTKIAEHTRNFMPEIIGPVYGGTSFDSVSLASDHERKKYNIAIVVKDDMHTKIPADLIQLETIMLWPGKDPIITQGSSGIATRAFTIDSVGYAQGQMFGFSPVVNGKKLSGVGLNFGSITSLDSNTQLRISIQGITASPWPIPDDTVIDSAEVTITGQDWIDLDSTGGWMEFTFDKPYTVDTSKRIALVTEMVAKGNDSDSLVIYNIEGNVNRSYWPKVAFNTGTWNQSEYEMPNAGLNFSGEYFFLPHPHVLTDIVQLTGNEDRGNRFKLNFRARVIGINYDTYRAVDSDAHFVLLPDNEPPGSTNYLTRTNGLSTEGNYYQAQLHFRDAIILEPDTWYRIVKRPNATLNYLLKHSIPDIKYAKQMGTENWYWTEDDGAGGWDNSQTTAFEGIIQLMIDQVQSNPQKFYSRAKRTIPI